MNPPNQDEIHNAADELFAAARSSWNRELRSKLGEVTSLGHEVMFDAIVELVTAEGQRLWGDVPFGPKIFSPSSPPPDLQALTTGLFISERMVTRALNFVQIAQSHGALDRNLAVIANALREIGFWQLTYDQAVAAIKAPSQYDAGAAGRSLESGLLMRRDPRLLAQSLRNRLPDHQLMLSFKPSRHILSAIMDDLGSLSAERRSAALNWFLTIAARVNPDLDQARAVGFLAIADRRYNLNNPDRAIAAFGASLYDEALAFGQPDIAYSLSPGFIALSARAEAPLRRHFAMGHGEGAWAFERVAGVGVGAEISHITGAAGILERRFVSNIASFEDEFDGVTRDMLTLRSGMSLSFGQIDQFSADRSTFFTQVENAGFGNLAQMRAKMAELNATSFGNAVDFRMTADGGGGSLPTRNEIKWMKAKNGFGLAADLNLNVGKLIVDVITNPVPHIEDINIDVTINDEWNDIDVDIDVDINGGVFEGLYDFTMETLDDIEDAKETRDEIQALEDALDLVEEPVEDIEDEQVPVDNSPQPENTQDDDPPPEPESYDPLADIDDEIINNEIATTIDPEFAESQGGGITPQEALDALINTFLSDVFPPREWFEGSNMNWMPPELIAQKFAMAILPWIYPPRDIWSYRAPKLDEALEAIVENQSELDGDANDDVGGGGVVEDEDGGELDQAVEVETPAELPDDVVGPFDDPLIQWSLIYPRQTLG